MDDRASRQAHKAAPTLVSRTSLLWVGGTALLLFAAQGIVGTIASDGFFWLFHRAITAGQSIGWPNLVGWIVIVFGVSILSGFSIWKYRRVSKKLERASGTARVSTSIVELDDSLFRLLPNLAPAPDPEAAMRNLLVEVLRDVALRVFDGAVTRAAVYRPNGEYLEPWVLDQIAPHSARRFYIGNATPIGRGIAGEAHRTRDIKVVHMRQVGDTWQSDHPAYVVFDEGRKIPPYRSFVAVPLLASTARSEGVVCFDSMDLTVFDSPEIEEILSALGRRIASALVLYEQVATVAQSRHPAAE